MRARARDAGAELGFRAICKACTLSGRTGELAVQVIWQAAMRRGYTNARVMQALVARGDVAVDVGASVGFFSRRLLQLVGPDGTVHAIEPNPAFRLGLESIRKRHSNLHVVTAAASDSPGPATLYIPRLADRPHPGLASLRAPDGGLATDRAPVQLVRLDDVVGDDPRGISFVKIDVEGHELEVLRGSPATLARGPSLMIEIEQRHHRDPIGDVIAGVTELGYEPWALSAEGLVPWAEFDVERDQLRYLTGGFQDALPKGYVNDFCFLPVGVDPPRHLRAQW